LGSCQFLTRKTDARRIRLDLKSIPNLNETPFVWKENKKTSRSRSLRQHSEKESLEKRDWKYSPCQHCALYFFPILDIETKSRVLPSLTMMLLFCNNNTRILSFDINNIGILKEQSSRTMCRKKGNKRKRKTNNEELVKIITRCLCGGRSLLVKKLSYCTLLEVFKVQLFSNGCLPTDKVARDKTGLICSHSTNEIF
jgi:hypothetical protein